MKRLTFLFLFIAFCMQAQQNLPLNRQWGLENERVLEQDSSIITVSCFKPYIIQPLYVKRDKSKSVLYRKIKKENLLLVEDSLDRFRLTLDPLFNFEFGKDLADTVNKRLYKNTRGILLKAQIGEKFVVESSFYENQATFTNYINDYILSTNHLFESKKNYQYNVIPGQGRSKQFKKNGYDYAMASGYVSYSPYRMLNIQLGHGKHFIGDGYRSLLLSDNAFNYPYARITTTYKNIQYTNLYTSFMNLTDGGVKVPAGIERLFQKKTGSFQLLSINFLRSITIGLFQGMIWEAADSTNRQHVNFNTFNPVIGINAIVYGLHHSNNIVTGVNIKYKIFPSLFLYGQYVLDESNRKYGGINTGNKSGYQIGCRYLNAFKVKNLVLQAEYNTVRPYTYAAVNPEQSYSHYNQPLAHPLGANFKEWVGIFNYRIADFFTEVKFNYIIKGNDSLFTNFGSNIFKSNSVITIPGGSNIQTTQGIKTITFYQDAQVGYLVNPSTNLSILLGLSNRIEKSNGRTFNTQYVYISIRTSLSNFYYDF